MAAVRAVITASVSPWVLVWTSNDWEPIWTARIATASATFIGNLVYAKSDTATASEADILSATVITTDTDSAEMVEVEPSALPDQVAPDEAPSKNGEAEVPSSSCTASTYQVVEPVPFNRIPASTPEVACAVKVKL